MNSNFEKDLIRQPVKNIPVQWKSEILQTAQRAAPPQPHQSPGTISRLRVGLRELFWPSPVAWGALGCAWIFLLVLANLSPLEGSARSAPPISPRELQMARQQHDWLRKELGSETVVLVPAVQILGTETGPRSDASSSRAQGLAADSLLLPKEQPFIV